MGSRGVMGAMMLCAFGTAPYACVVLPTNQFLAGNIMEYKPVVNMPPFAGQVQTRVT